MSSKLLTITIWACPTPECGNYFGSSSSPDLSQAKVRPSVDSKHDWERAHPGQEYKFTRDQCPECRVRGKEVARIKVTTTVLVPIPDTISEA